MQRPTPSVALARHTRIAAHHGGPQHAQLEAAASSVREERRRSEAALEAAEARWAAREGQLRQEWEG
jgi:hypothetical protein